VESRGEGKKKNCSGGKEPKKKKNKGTPYKVVKGRGALRWGKGKSLLIKKGGWWFFKGNKYKFFFVI